MAGTPGTTDPIVLGWERLRVRRPADLAAESGAVLSADGTALRLRVAGRDYDVDLAHEAIRRADEPATVVGPYLQILILHYLAGAGDAPMADRPATFQEFEGGDVYYAAFTRRVVDRLVRAFGAAPGRLATAGASLGAEPVALGSVAFRVPFFPKLPLTVVLWLGDDEVPASANVLFDANAGRILPTEDLAVAAEGLVQILVKVGGTDWVEPAISVRAIR